MTGGVSFGVAIPHRSGSPLETSTIRAVAVRAESLGFNDLWPDFRSRWAHESAKSGFDLHVWRNGVVGVVPPGLLEGLIPRKDGIMPASKKYPEGLRQRAQRMVAEAMSEDRSLSMTGAVKRIGPRVGVVPETLRGWIRQGDIDVGRRSGTTTSDAAEVKELKAEVRELKRANEILLAASSFFARELDPRLPW